MGFREKMAWVMVVALSAFGAIYFIPTLSAFPVVGFVSPLSASVGTLGVIALIVVASLGAIIAALSNVREANSPLDEREAYIVARSETYGGAVLGFGAVTLVILAHFTAELGWIVPSLVALLTVSHLVTHCVQIAMFRTL